MNAVPSPVRPAYRTAATQEEIQANLADIRASRSEMLYQVRKQIYG